MGKIAANVDDNPWKNRIVKLTGALVVVPALLNAGYDAVVAVAKLPRTDAERANSALFQKYFNKLPIAVVPVPIKHSMGTIEAKFQIYEEGEVYVEYGKMSQWFPFPVTREQKQANFSLIPEAIAQTSVSKEAPEGGVIRQSDSISGKFILRDRELSGGKFERSKIDMRSGKIVEFERLDTAPAPLSSKKFEGSTLKLEKSIELKR